MGVMWTVLPIDGEMQDWLSSLDMEIPEGPSRWPTGGKIKRALAEMDMRVDLADNGPLAPMSAFIERDNAGEHEWANLLIQRYAGDDEPQEFYFKKGHESLIKAVLQTLVPLCGPLVLINDADGEPEVVSA